MEPIVHRGISEGRPVPRQESLASCFCCRLPHRAEHPVSICPACVAKSSAMRLLEMTGFYPLRSDVVNTTLKRVSPGNFALGYVVAGEFNVFYVARSDFDVRLRISKWVNMPSRCRRSLCSAKASWEVNHRKTFPVDAPALGRVGNFESRYTHFAYSYARSADEAYAKEWRNYEAFGGRASLDNESQPAFLEAEWDERDNPIFWRRFGSAEQ